jgi:16S rRNA (guanine527-N7)-methyltransferase
MNTNRSCGKTVEEEKILVNTEEGIGQYINMGVLALGISLPEENINKFIIYIKMIQTYQKKVNITSIQDTFDIINKHFLDSLSCIGIINNLGKTFQQGKRLKIIDVGSGAGFPGVPVKMVLSDASMCLLEARKNRILFLREVIDKLELTDTKVVQDRAEKIGKAAEFREKYHIVLSRAVATLGVLCEYCLPLCQINGVMIAFKGSSYHEELSDNKEVIERLGGIMESINVVRIPHSNHLRYILVIRKIKPTPERFPRKNGIPQKRPLYFK